MFKRIARNGGALFYEFDGEIVAISLINPRYGILNALNVSPTHREHGLGSAILNFLIPNFVRAIESKVSWFEKRGYRKIGKLKKGVSLNTQVMARSALFELAGNLRKAWV
jgi:N-acetylglutamate synthase-like GNAT family acetyltransferase